MRRSFTLIFVINLIIRIFIQGLLPLFPIIAEKIGISKQNNGLLLAASYTMLLTGTWLTGRLIPRFINAKLLFQFSLFPICVSLALFGIANHETRLLFCSLALFFFAGLNITAGLILIGYYSSLLNVGKNFGIIGLSNLLGSLLGGFIVGPVLFQLGYIKGFTLFAITLLLVSLSAFFIANPLVSAKEKQSESFKFTKEFIYLLISSVLAIMLIHVFLFSFSLSLKQNNYTIKDISILSALGTAIVLPLPYVLGKLTLKYHPKLLLVIIYLLMAIALALLLLPKKIPIILLAVACMSILAHGGRAVIVALIFPWYNKNDLPMAQSYLGVAAWMAAIIGYILTGQLLQRTTFEMTIFVGLSVAALSIFILLIGVKTTKTNSPSFAST